MSTDNEDICLGRLFWDEQSSTTKSHPNVIISDPAKDPGRVVVVNLSSMPTLGDSNCYTVEPGDHPRITKQSFIRGEFSALTTAEVLKGRQKATKISLTRELASADMLRKIQRGIGESRLASGEVKSVLRSQGYIK